MFVAFDRTWIIPRFLFWSLWTAWLACLEYLHDRVSTLSGWESSLLILGPPLVGTALLSWLSKNPTATAWSHFVKGAIASCFIAVYANLLVGPLPGYGLSTFLPVLAVAGILLLRRRRSERAGLPDSELLARTRALAARMGVVFTNVVVFRSKTNLPAAFAVRSGIVLASDSLIRLLSKTELEAVIAHELAHLRDAQKQWLRLIPVGIPILMASAMLIPGARMAAPLVPLLVVLVWCGIRRKLEYDADAAACSAVDDAGALITALTRVAAATNLPLDWGPIGGAVVAHPPMAARFRAIANRAHLSQSAVDQLVAAASVPALDHYPSPFDSVEQRNGSPALTAYRARIHQRLTILSAFLPILAGVCAALAMGVWASTPMLAGAICGASIVAGILLYYFLYDGLVGSARDRLRTQVPSAGAGDFFVGVSNSPEPVVFDGLYHFDIGRAVLDGPLLRFQGTRYAFALAGGQIHRISIVPGPRHWMPRPVVCLEYRMTDAVLPAVITLQPFESRSWPGTAKSAERLCRALTEWAQPAHESPETMAPPQIEGQPAIGIPVTGIWKSFYKPCMVSYVAASALPLILLPGSPAIFAAFVAPMVTAAVILFSLLPYIDPPDSAPRATRRQPIVTAPQLKVPQPGE